MSEPNRPLNPPVKKRRRPALSCEQCRRRKVRCDRGSPCATCVQTGNKTCSYAAPPRPRATHPRVIWPSPPESSEASPDGTGGAPEADVGAEKPTPSQGSSNVDWVFGRTLLHSGDSRAADTAIDVKSLTERIRDLEWQVQTGRPAPGLKRVEKGGNAPLRGMLEKTRFFGPSHWSNAVQLFNFLLGLAIKSAERKDEAHAILCDCKALARLIKAGRQPLLDSTAIGTHLVAAAVATPLLETYLSTFELAHRVLHIPSFRRDYDRFLADPTTTPLSFKIQLQLCLAIGASMRDPRFELRSTAIQWVYEARLWLIMPPEKDRISVTGVQVMCLLHIARQAVGVAPGVAWPDVGSLLRSAIFAGMHRDPARLPAMTVLRAEVRRRLWATILEISLQTAIDAGAPPLVSQDHYDTEPPSNLDDDELTDEPEPPERRSVPSDRHTQTSLQLLLLAHIPVRLAVARFANDFRSSNSYDEALRLHERITTACHDTSRRLVRLVAETGSSAAPVTVFHQRYVELTTRRLILALHYSFLEHIHDPAYFFSRKVLTDVARRLAPLHVLPANPTPGAEAFCNFVICSTGFSRTVMQAFILLGPELATQKREEMENYGEAGDAGADLRALLEGASTWMEARIRAGETNVKGYMFLKAMLGEVEAVAAGLEGEAMEEFVLERMKGSMATAYATMMELARESGIAVDGVGDMVDLGTPPVEFQEGFGPGDPFDSLGWQMDWEDMANMSSFLM